MIISNSTKRRTKNITRPASRGVPAPGPLAVLFLTIISSLASAEDWPVARGDAASTGVATCKITDTPDLLWKYEAKNALVESAEEDAGDDVAFEAAAVVQNGIAYVGDTAGAVHALRLTDGSPVWTKRFEEASFSSPAAVESDYVYLVDADGVVRCLGTKDGEQQWEFATESEVYAGPNLYKDSLLVTTETGDLISLRTKGEDAGEATLKAGSEQWRFTIDSPLRCIPTVVSGHALLAGCDGALHAIDLNTGKESALVEIGGPTGSSAATFDGRAYFGTEQGEFFAIDVTANSNQLSKLTQAWTYRDPRRGQGIRTAPAVTKKIVIYASQAKTIYAVDAKSGEPVWKKTTRAGVDSSPVIAGDRVIAATTRGKLMLLNLKDGETVWSYEAGGGFAASPAVVDEKIILGNTNGTLYCFGKK